MSYVGKSKNDALADRRKQCKMGFNKFDSLSLNVIIEVTEWNLLNTPEMVFSLTCNDYCLQAKLDSICPSFHINPVCAQRGSKNSGDR